MTAVQCEVIRYGDAKSPCPLCPGPHPHGELIACHPAAGCGVQVVYGKGISPEAVEAEVRRQMELREKGSA